MIQNLLMCLLKHLIFRPFQWSPAGAFFSLPVNLLYSSAQACQSIFSQNQKVFNSASLFQVSELPFQFNATATLPLTIISLISSAICIFLLNLLFSFILLTCSFCFILLILFAANLLIQQSVILHQLYDILMTIAFCIWDFLSMYILPL